jgi:uncharacterized membrane protein
MSKGDSTMTTIVRDITIKAPVENVFAFLADPRNLTEVWPNMLAVENVQESNNGGYTYDWTYKMSGVNYTGQAETIEFLTNRQIVTKSSKGLESVHTWGFRSSGNETRLSLKLEYRIPTALLLRLKEPTLVQENEHEVDAMLQNVKSRMELEVLYA